MGGSIPADWGVDGGEAEEGAELEDGGASGSDCGDEGGLMG